MYTSHQYTNKREKKRDIGKEKKCSSIERSNARRKNRHKQLVRSHWTTRGHGKGREKREKREKTLKGQSNNDIQLVCMDHFELHQYMMLDFRRES